MIIITTTLGTRKRGKPHTGIFFQDNFILDLHALNMLKKEEQKGNVTNVWLIISFNSEVDPNIWEVSFSNYIQERSNGRTDVHDIQTNQ